MENGKEMITIKEAAELLEMAPGTIRRKIKEGRIKAQKIEGPFGPQWVIDPEELTRASQIIEVIPVKHNLTPDKLEIVIRQATQEAARQGARDAIEGYMQEHLQELRGLREQVERLEQQLKENEKTSIFKRLFNIVK